MKFSMWLLERLTSAELRQGSPQAMRILTEFLNRLSGDSTATAEDTTFRTFNQDTIVRVMANCHLHAVCELTEHIELGSGVVGISLSGPAVFERYQGAWRESASQMLGRFLKRIDGPLRDINVVCSPVGHLATGVFVPPAEVTVRSFANVLLLRSLALPHLPIEICLADHSL